MKVQSIDSSQNTFGAMKLNRLRVKPRTKRKLTYEQEQERNQNQAILFCLAFIAASLTKYFIDRVNRNNPEPKLVEISTSQRNDSIRQDTFQYKR